jgi:hypothetical protein
MSCCDLPYFFLLRIIHTRSIIGFIKEFIIRTDADRNFLRSECHDQFEEFSVRKKLPLKSD